MKAFWTDYSGKGGAVAIFSSKLAHKIKNLNENVILTTNRNNGSLVHYVTVYIPPNYKEMADICVRQLKWVLHKIVLMDK